MQFGFVAAGEETGRFQHNINVQFFPRKVCRIAILHDPDLVTAHDDILVVVTDLAVEFAVHRIPFEQMCQRMCVREIVYREHPLQLLL